VQVDHRNRDYRDDRDRDRDRDRERHGYHN
jgi:hypothetical protein